MKKKVLGKTGITMTEITLGALTMGPLQAKLSTTEAKKVILAALDKGINSIDTAEMYGMDEPIKAALSEYRGEVILASKSTATSYSEMEKSVLGALSGLGRDYLDIFYLHAAKVTPEVFEERSGAFQCLLDYKSKGVIRAVGIATHVVPVVEKAAKIEEIDVVFPLINVKGVGIVGGSAADMVRAIKLVSESGKGLVAMKSLAGGNLLREIKTAFSFVRNIEGITSVAVGMSHVDEVEVNVRLFEDEDIMESDLERLRSTKELFVARFCTGCGTCVQACPNEALTVKEGQVIVEKNKCILCGYCNPTCPEFALRLI
ncbi:MAG: hypothetical protein APF84_15455 [Gracilibacter sp. BRH_c7a]|nr:MAG: hypothetical protein APF84_15455 [Gracilibacter sp. BRH_c7a]